ncbi:MBL fold metallo-hydrolase [Oscillospiraceae bacterium PP1C4]
MHITVLTDNYTYIDRYYLGEPAVSYYIQADGKNILFDAGYSDVFLKNGHAMGVDFSSLDYLAISHGHNDHTGGLGELLPEFQGTSSKPIFVAHPDVFEQRYADGLNISPSVTAKELEQCFSVRLTRQPLKLTENLYFLGEIPRQNDFESQKAVGICRSLSGDICDFVADDSALVYKGGNGIYLITGCSHAGICNIIEYAKKVTGESRILGVLGGFHLFELDNQTEKTIQYLKQQEIPALYPCHCTSLRVKAEMMKEMSIEEVGVGLTLEWL